ncbi:MAG: hypothetical protein JWM80_2468 [Cyanobacteria bacterium RYN_339]|nr:hypothetical protein [Cyanobacteria bacterium RYN_339]
MMMSIRCALVGAAIVAMAGCTGTTAAGLGNLLPSTAPSGGTSGAVSSGGAACATNTGGAAASPTTANSAHGNYNGQTIPNGWDTSYKTQTDLDGGFTNLKNTNPNAWVTAKCIYQPAIATWSKNTGNTP